MKTLKHLLLLLFLILASQELQGSHVKGADLTLTCLSACTTRVTLRVYRSCDGALYSPTAISWTAPGCTPPPQVGPNSAVFRTELSPVCPTVVTMCTSPGASIAGIEEMLSYKDYDICAGTPCTYDVAWIDCCRNSSITSLAGPGGQSISVHATVNTTLPVCNNSPQVASPSTFYICQGMDYDFMINATDVEGDSLAYSLYTCMQLSGQPVVYNTNYSPTSPLGPDWNVTIHPLTGLLHVDANPGSLQIGVICIAIDEYRNGALIGTVRRDVTVSVMNCPANDHPDVALPSNITGAATLWFNELHAYANGAPICFDITTSDINPGQGMRLFWTDFQSTTATFTDVTNSNIADTIVGSSSNPPAGRFCWTPTVPGYYTFSFRVEDDVCPVTGFSQYILPVIVSPCNNSTATATPGNCPDVSFAGSTCIAPPLTYSWTGAGGLSASTLNTTHTYPGPGIYPWQFIVTNGSTSDTVTGTVTVGPGPVQDTLFTGLSTLTPCTGQVYDTLEVGSWASYLWSNGQTTPEIVVNTGGTYSVTVVGPNGCAYYDTTTVLWAAPDIYGNVTTSVNGPLQNQKILLIQHDTLAQTLWAVDSTWTDSMGYYFFCNVTDSIVFLKATPSAVDYPNEMPTYADTTLFWNTAITFYPLTQIPFQHDFSTLFGINPGGPGFIGGLISQGANKTGAVGDPMPGVRVFLRDQNTGNILGNRVTDANGYFSFAGIPLGDYEIVPDRPLVSTTNVPQLSLTTQQPVMDSLDFQMHRYWLELVLHPTAVQPEVPGLAISIRPNPFRGSTEVILSLQEEAEVSWEAYDIRGLRVAQFASTLLPRGDHRIHFGDDIPAGIYLIRLRFGPVVQVLKVVKASD